MSLSFRHSVLGLALALVASESLAQVRSYDAFCDVPDFDAPLRSTSVVIDSRMIEPETDGPLETNKTWRQRVATLLDASGASALSIWAPRERVSVSVADASTGSLREIFSGCLPLYSADEQRELDGSTSRMQTFFGRDWRRAHEKNVGEFRRGLTFAMVTAARDIDNASAPGTFIDSGLGQALARGYRPSLESGIPRLVLVTDPSIYELPKGDTAALKAQAREDAAVWNANLGRSEVHIIGDSGNLSASEKDYIQSLFLSGQGEILTLAGLNGAMLSESAPTRVDIFQGLVDFPDGQYPVMMRLAIDKNRKAVNSWIQIQSDQMRFVPFDGAMSCTGARCKFQETSDFAQIWTDAPGGDPEFEQWMPFVGFRDMSFTIDGDTLSGLISDSSGYVPGMEDGLAFKLDKVESGSF